MRTKSNIVNLHDLHPKLLAILPVINNWWKGTVGYDLIITSGCDGSHMFNSDHYIGCAVDIRTWDDERSGNQLDLQRRTEIRDGLEAHLKDWYGKEIVFILDEGTHFHIALRTNSPLRWEDVV